MHKYRNALLSSTTLINVLRISWHHEFWNALNQINPLVSSKTGQCKHLLHQKTNFASTALFFFCTSVTFASFEEFLMPYPFPPHVTSPPIHLVSRPYCTPVFPERTTTEPGNRSETAFTRTLTHPYIQLCMWKTVR